jgi:hypothetical protein
MPAKKKVAALPPTNFEQIERFIHDSGISDKKGRVVLGHLDKTFDVLNQQRVQNLANGLIDWLSANVSPTSGKYPATTTELQMALLLVQMRVFDMFRAHAAAKTLKSLGRVLENARAGNAQSAEASSDYTASTEIPEDARNIYG